MAQFFLKIAHLSFLMGPAPSLKMVFSYGLRPRLWLLPCAESRVFSARNHMLTRVVAKQAKTTKVKNKFVSGKKSSKEHSVVFLVEGEKFNLGERNSAIKFRQKVQICLVGSVQSRSAHRLSSQLFAAVSTSNIAELVLFGFFCPQPWFLRRFEHILPGKTPAFSC